MDEAAGSNALLMQAHSARLNVPSGPFSFFIRDRANISSYLYLWVAFSVPLFLVVQEKYFEVAGPFLWVSIDIFEWEVQLALARAIV